MLGEILNPMTYAWEVDEKDEPTEFEGKTYRSMKRMKKPPVNWKNDALEALAELRSLYPANKLKVAATALEDDEKELLRALVVKLNNNPQSKNTLSN